MTQHAEDTRELWRRRRAGEVCYVWDCLHENPEHSIVRRCRNGHRLETRYCSDHIDELMALALHPPGWLPDGTFLGIALCPECYADLKVVTENSS